MQGYLIVTAAVMMQLCLGATYSWSVYVASIRDLTDMSQWAVQLPFSLFYFIFPLTMIFSGALLTKKGPRFCAMFGGALFGLGWITAGQGIFHFSLTIIGIGLIAGMGAGIAYIVPLATCIKWFPRHKGMVTGIAVAGFGGGAALVSQIGGVMMAHFEKSPFDVFLFMGILFFLLTLLAGFVMQDPPHAISNEGLPSDNDSRSPAGTCKAPQSKSNTGLPSDNLIASALSSDESSQGEPGLSTAVSSAPLRASSILSQKVFWLLYGAMFAGLAAGFAVNANLKELYGDGAGSAGVTAVSLFALANAAGRISWGALFDRFKPSWVVRANLMAQALFLILSPILLDNKTGFFLFSFAAGFNYGGVLVLYASSSASLWGSAHMGRIYGWLFSSNIPAALAPIFAGWCFDLQGSFTWPFFIIAGILILSVFLFPNPLETEPSSL